VVVSHEAPENPTALYGSAGFLRLATVRRQTGSLLPRSRRPAALRLENDFGQRSRADFALSIAPARRETRPARSCKDEEYRRNQHSAGRRSGFREFSTRKKRKNGSRRSFNIVARRGSGTDCPRFLRSVFMGGWGVSRGGAPGAPLALAAPLDAARGRKAASPARSGRL